MKSQCVQEALKGIHAHQDSEGQVEPDNIPNPNLIKIDLQMYLQRNLL